MENPLEIVYNKEHKRIYVFHGKYYFWTPFDEESCKAGALIFNKVKYALENNIEIKLYTKD